MERWQSRQIGSVSVFGLIASAGQTAVITGAATGIGKACARFCACQHMNLVLADINSSALEATVDECRRITANGCGIEATVEGHSCNVADPVSVRALKEAVFAKHDSISFLFLNAGTGCGGGALAPRADWAQTIGTNLWGVIHCAQAFVPEMQKSDMPGMVVITGSKQGITCPPGNLAYNVSKAAVKAYAEGLQHELRSLDDNKLSCHLLIPGKRAEAAAKGAQFDPDTVFFSESKPADGAWSPDQVIDFMIGKLAAGSFYIVCPDNETDEQTDKARIEWAAQDITMDRVPLSRWHFAYKKEFESFLKKKLDRSVV